MIRDGQVRKLRCLLDAGDSLALASRKTGMDDKSARKYRDSNELPSQREMPPRAWRTRIDPFEEVWPQVQARSEAEPLPLRKTGSSANLVIPSGDLKEIWRCPVRCE
jgi:hypothetical protein